MNVSLFVIACAALLAAGGPESGEQAAADPSIVILADTGQRRDGMPVLRQHADPARYIAVLSRGFSGRLLRLYRLEQRFMHPDRATRPAYLFLSDNQGGFPRAGFYLGDAAHAGVPYVDLHARSALSGRAGAIDQIFPHELLHIIVHDLAGEPPAGCANQVHAIGVRTDRVTAFDEGFAEHGQVMAIVDADAMPDTRALAGEGEAERAMEQFRTYARALSARWSVVPKTRMTFPFWFSGAEQVLRYHAVRQNLFAFEPEIPDRLRAPAQAYKAYLLENVMPGSPRMPSRTAPRMLATEGVISTLFSRLVTAPEIQQVYRDPSFYGLFGIDRAAVGVLDNAYLKVFAAIHDGGYDAASVMRAYARLFPDEASRAGAIVHATLNGQDLRQTPEIWLLNDRFSTGTSLFDQFRGRPRPHTFDLNAAALADLAGVAGMTTDAAAAIRAGAPYASIADVGRVPQASPAVRAELARLESAMRMSRAADTEAEAGLSMKAIVTPYIYRAVWALLAGAVGAGALYRCIRRVSWWRLAVNGVAASLAGLLAGWTIDAGTGALAFAAPALVFGLPGAVWRGLGTRSPREGAMVLGAWVLAGAAPFLLVRPLG